MHAAMVAAQQPGLLAGGDVPQMDVVIQRGNRQGLVVTQKNHSRQPRIGDSVAAQGASAVYVHQAKRAVEADRRQRFAVRRKGDAGDVILVSVKVMQRLAGGYVPYACTVAAC